MVVNIIFFYGTNLIGVYKEGTGFFAGYWRGMKVSDFSLVICG
jgi:hypothetical protein